MQNIYRKKVAQPAIFYSGGLNGDLAASYAGATGRVLIGDTRGGSALTEMNLFPRMVLDSDGVVVPRYAAETQRVWDMASQRYAAEASGDITLFVRGASPAGTFMRVELQALRQNPNIAYWNYLADGP